MPLLNNLIKLGRRQENAEITSYVLTSLVYLQQENVNKSKMMKIINNDEENFHIFPKTSGISMKSSGKFCLM